MSLIIGTIGATLILIAFLLVQLNKLDVHSFIYNVINFIGSILLIIYAVLGMSYPFIILNSVWALFSLKDIVSKLMTND